jgi:hypothetical protein
LSLSFVYFTTRSHHYDTVRRLQAVTNEKVRRDLHIAVDAPVSGDDSDDEYTEDSTVSDSQTDSTVRLSTPKEINPISKSPSVISSIVNPYNMTQKLKSVFPIYHSTDAMTPRVYPGAKTEDELGTLTFSEWLVWYLTKPAHKVKLRHLYTEQQYQDVMKVELGCLYNIT